MIHKVEVFVNGVLVLAGEGKVEEHEEGEYEMVVEDASGHPFIVQFSDEKIDLGE